MMFVAKDGVEGYQLERASNISREGYERVFYQFQWFVYLYGGAAHASSSA
jgi:hypothetical protein